MAVITDDQFSNQDNYARVLKEDQRLEGQHALDAIEQLKSRVEGNYPGELNAFQAATGPDKEVHKVALAGLTLDAYRAMHLASKHLPPTELQDMAYNFYFRLVSDGLHWLPTRSYGVKNVDEMNVLMELLKPDQGGASRFSDKVTGILTAQLGFQQTQNGKVKSGISNLQKACGYLDKAGLGNESQDGGDRGAGAQYARLLYSHFDREALHARAVGDTRAYVQNDTRARTWHQLGQGYIDSAVQEVAAGKTTHQNMDFMTTAIGMEWRVREALLDKNQTQRAEHIAWYMDASSNLEGAPPRPLRGLPGFNAALPLLSQFGKDPNVTLEVVGRVSATAYKAYQADDKDGFGEFNAGLNALLEAWCAKIHGGANDEHYIYTFEAAEDLLRRSNRTDYQFWVNHVKNLGV